MDYSDQTKIFDTKTWSWPVHLIGAGGINNLVGPTLAKMGVREIHIWDDDILEVRNCPTEVAYSYRMAGQPKTTAMADAIRYLMDGFECGASGTFSPTPASPDCYQHKIGRDLVVYAHNCRVEADTPLTGVVVCGVDSMTSRKMIWENVKERFLEVPLFIDGRSAGEETAIYAFAPTDFEACDDYESWLFDDSEALQLECGARNIGYIAAYMAAEIARIITRFHRELPIEFYTVRDFSQK